MLSLESVIWKILSFISQNPSDEYEIAVGTDSMTKATETKIATAITVHRKGKGAIFFYKVFHHDPIKDLHQKLYTETQYSLDLANFLIDAFGKTVLRNESNIHFVVHLDVGENGPTSKLIQELEGWVNAMGYEAVIKPNSYCSSSCADRISK